MKKILAIGGSNSSKSINKLFATHIANKIENVEVTVFDWNDFILPLYGPDLENEQGIHENAVKFKNLIEEMDAIILSLAEYNGLPTTAFKNLWDWTSRIKKKFWDQKPMFLTATSPGGKGGANVHRVIKETIPHFGGNVTAEFSLPLFHQNFKEGVITDKDLETALDQQIQLFKASF